ncbi:hypothetical protein EJB05_01711, partial [Eragrostis curvula]
MAGQAPYPTLGIYHTNNNPPVALPLGCSGSSLNSSGSSGEREGERRVVFAWVEETLGDARGRRPATVLGGDGASGRLELEEWVRTGRRSTAQLAREDGGEHLAGAGGFEGAGNG